MRWKSVPIATEESINALANKLTVPKVIAKLLAQRGITSFEQAKFFFRPEWLQLHDPFLMKDMQAAVARIVKAIDQQEKVMVYGDYDVDGTTSVALVTSYFKDKINYLTPYIPDRYKEGYGISMSGIDAAKEKGITLIIALDCGIKAHKQVIYAAEIGIDFIICDHHRPGAKLPKAVAVLDPKRDDCSYPYKELCGCGVGFKLIQALGSERGQTIEDLLLYLDLVATAIGADIVPVTGENRVLAYYGLQVINSNPRVGYQAILKQVNKSTLTITDVVFIIAPRINAAGRMKHGNHAVRLLVESDLEKAAQWASEIELFNADRKDADKQITKEALAQIIKASEQENNTTVVYKEHWHKGVIGIVASRLIETYYRPTLVFTKSGDKLAASARSVKGFDVYNALEGCAQYIEQFGGHKYAAGLTLQEKDYPGFKAQFEKVVSQTIDPKLLNPEINIDAQLDLVAITPKFHRILKQFAPFGPGNRQPVFMTQNLKDTGYGKCVGADKTHLRLTVKQVNSKAIVGIGFGLGDKKDTACSDTAFKAVFCIDENLWQGKVSLQLRIKDIQPS